MQVSERLQRMQLILRQFDLPLRHTWTISRSSTSVKRTLIVELRQDGARGFGEAGENEYYRATADDMSAALDRVRPIVEDHRLDDPVDFWEEVRAELAECPFAQCALDVAACDLWGKLRGRPLWQLWGLGLQNLPPSDYTIGIDSVDVMVKKLQEFPGWPVYKIKLGTPRDLEIVGALREHTDAAFRVDANCAWTAEETIRNSVALQRLGVELIEQPLEAGDWRGMSRVYRESVLPVVADESCRVESDVDRAAECFHGINVKLVKCGGLTPARRMIARARQLGLKVMLGCMTESTVGISAIAQLLPLADSADLDGALLLARDIATGVTIDRGRMHYPEENGCGVRLL